MRPLLPRRAPGAARRPTIAGLPRATALAALLLLAGCQVELFSGLPEREANDMVAILLRNGLSASKSTTKDGTDTILVEKGQFAQVVDLLRARGYPRRKFSSMGDVFQPSGLIASPMQEQARFLWALSQELSSTVSEIDGVLTARVQVVLPDNDLLKRDPTPSSASVFIRYDDQSGVASLVPQIKTLVANSVEGLSYDKVSVVLVPVPHVQLPPQPRQAAPLDSQVAGAAGGAAAVLIAGGLGLVFRRRIAALLAAIRVPAQRARFPGPAE